MSDKVDVLCRVAGTDGIVEAGWEAEVEVSSFCAGCRECDRGGTTTPRLIEMSVGDLNCFARGARCHVI